MDLQGKCSFEGPVTFDEQHQEQQPCRVEACLHSQTASVQHQGNRYTYQGSQNPMPRTDPHETQMPCAAAVTSTCLPVEVQPLKEVARDTAGTSLLSCSSNALAAAP